MNRIELRPEFFNEAERAFASGDAGSAALFKFDSGVCGVRLENSRGQLVLLPFQGQQIWSARFEGRDLQMKSMFAQPRPTTDYLGTYGGLFLHCGAVAMGVPGPEDDHPLHGELPNAPYQEAYLVFGEDEGGAFVGLGGAYQHTVAFNHNYRFEPLVKLYAGSTVFTIEARLTNLKKTPTDWMYMGHLNFRPRDGGRLVYSGPCTPEHTRVSVSVPDHIKGSADTDKYVAFLEALAADPTAHTHLTDDLLLDPEVVMAIDYLAGDDGWAHSLQVRPDGWADYIAHRPEQLPVGVRWIARTPDQDALGLCLPATAEHHGYTAEKAQGRVGQLAAGASATVQLEAGLLDPEAAGAVEKKIGGILAGGDDK